MSYKPQKVEESKNPAISGGISRIHADQFPISYALVSNKSMMVGVFSSYAKQLEQGWRLLQEAPDSPQTAELQQFPRSLARITPNRLAEMITDYEAGMSAYELADKYGHNRGTIMKHLAGAGVRSRVAVPTR